MNIDLFISVCSVCVLALSSRPHTPVGGMGGCSIYMALNPGFA